MRKRGKRLLSMILSLSLVAGSAAFQGNFVGETKVSAATTLATEETLENFTYTRNGVGSSEVTITKYTGFATELNLGEIFEEYGLTVTVIGEAAFYERKNLTSVTIPHEVTTIRGNAFLKCSGLTKVTFEKDDKGKCSLKTIYGAAFAETALTDISIPGSVTSLGAGGKSTSGLIPGDGSNPFKGTFYNCTNLKRVTFEEGTEPLSLYGNKSSSSGDRGGDFSYCTSLSTLVFPDRITEIPNYECAGSGVTNVTLPDTVTVIADGAFYKSSIASINFPKNLKTIGEWAFGNSSIAGDIVFPEKLEMIGVDAFYKTEVTNVTFPASMTSIGEGAFGSCKSLNTATFLGSVMSGKAFDNINKDVFTVYAYKDLGNTIRNQCQSNGYKFNYLSKSVDIKQVPAKTKYTYGEKLDATGLVLTAEVENSDGTTESESVEGVEIDSCKFNGYSAEKAGPQTVTVSYGKQSAQFDVAVRYDLSSSRARYSTKNYYTYTGEAIVPDVTVTYDSKEVPKDSYKVTASSNVNVGRAAYKVTATDEDYAIGENSGTFTIEEKSLMDEDIFVTVNPESLDYTGKECIPDIVVTHLSGGKEILLKEGKDYSLRYSREDSWYEDTENVGEVTVIIYGMGNYTDSIVTTYSIEALDIGSENSGVTVKNIPDQTYTGDILCPEVTVNRTVEGVTQSLKKGTDYETSYSYNQTAGTATVTIKGKGNYKGTIKKEFVIKPMELTSEKIYIPVFKDCMYTGKEIKPELRVCRGYFQQGYWDEYWEDYWEDYVEEDLVEGIDYVWNVSGSAMDSEGRITGYGDVTVTIEGRGNYAGTVTRTFNVNVSMQDVTVQDIPAQAYTGGSIEPEVRVSFGDDVLVQEEDYTIIYVDNTDAGTARIVLTGAGYFTETKIINFTIEPVDISKGAIDAIPDQDIDYIDWQGVRPSVRVTVDGEVLYWGTDYTVAYENNDRPGTAVVTVTGIGNYKGTISTTFKIKEIVETPEPTPTQKPTPTPIPTPTQNPGQQTEPPTPTQDPGQQTEPPTPTQNPGQQTEMPTPTQNPGQPTASPLPTQKPVQQETPDDNEDDGSSRKQTIKVKVVTKNVKAKQLRRKAVTFSIKASAKGKITCRKVSGSKKLTISKTGKVKIKKGTKKGTYEIKVKITASAKAGYPMTTVTKTIRVICK